MISGMIQFYFELISAWKPVAVRPGAVLCSVDTSRRFLLGRIKKVWGRLGSINEPPPGQIGANVRPMSPFFASEFLMECLVLYNENQKGWGAAHTAPCKQGNEMNEFKSINLIGSLIKSLCFFIERPKKGAASSQPPR